MLLGLLPELLESSAELLNVTHHTNMAADHQTHILGETVHEVEQSGSRVWITSHDQTLGSAAESRVTRHITLRQSTEKQTYCTRYYKQMPRSCFLPEVLDMILDSTEAQGVSQSLVVGQGLGRGAPVHIWNHQGIQFSRTRHCRAA